MHTIDEILAAAAALSPADLGKLRSEIERPDRVGRGIAPDEFRSSGPG